jgi:hypothetical protein
VGRRADGRLQVDVVGGDGRAYQEVQNVANGGWPGTWTDLGGSMQQLVLGNYIDNSLHLFGLGRDDIAYVYNG